MTLRTLKFACVIGLSILGGAGEQTLAQKAGDANRPFPLRISIDITWTNYKPCQHAADVKCGTCQVKGHLSATIDARLGKAPGTAAWEPVGSAAAQIDYDERVFCPIDGESGHDAGRTTAPLRGPSSFAKRPMALNEGHVSWTTVPHGMGPNLLDEYSGADRRSMSTAQGIQALNNMEYLVPFAASVDVTGLTGSPWTRDVSLMLLQPGARKSGSVSWQVRGGDYHDGAAFDIRVVDTVGVTRGQRHTNDDPDNHAVINYLVTWRMGDPDHTTKIKKPANNDEFVFGKDEADNIRFEAEAHANPPSYDPKLQPWHIGDVAGSTLEIKKRSGDKEVDGAPIGPEVLIRYKKLPSLNDSFGYKNLTCDNAEPVVVRVFYRKQEKDNPGGEQVNWYYYWKQGVVPNLERFSYFESDNVVGGFTPPSTLTISNQGGRPEKDYSVTLYKTDLAPTEYRARQTSVAGKEEWPRKTSIENCHATVLHELLHKAFYDNFGAQGTNPDDRDRDGLPDWCELASVYQIDPLYPDTHMVAVQLRGPYRTYGDQELLCRINERLNAPKKNLDWSWPGSQSTPPEK